ncbi:MAG: hypothetical protein ACTSPS_18420 [Promethearchaeota archaeon]
MELPISTAKKKLKLQYLKSFFRQAVVSSSNANLYCWPEED